jgi:hypothetical protein
MLRSPASKELDAGGGRDGRRALRSFADLQAGVSEGLFADAARDVGDAGRTRENPGTTVCWGGSETLHMHTRKRARARHTHTHTNTHKHTHTHTH